MILTPDLLDLYAAALREIPFVEDVGFEPVSTPDSDTWAPDVRVLIDTPRGRVHLSGEVKTSSLTKAVAHALLSRLGPETGDWISPRDPRQ